MRNLLPIHCCFSPARWFYRIVPVVLVLAAGGSMASALLAQSPSPSASAASPSAVTAPAEPAPSPSVPAVATPVEKLDLIATATAAGNFKTFLKAVEAAGLTATLQKPGPYTVFAPTDTAFSKLPPGTLDDLLKPENKAKLVTLVSYHIAQGKLMAADLSKTDEVKTLEGTEIDVDTVPEGKVIEVDDAKILGSDVEATNGVLHAIDGVLQP